MDVTTCPVRSASFAKLRRGAPSNRSIGAAAIHAVAERAIDRVRDLVANRHRRKRAQIYRALFNDEESGRRHGPGVDVDADAETA